MKPRYRYSYGTKIIAALLTIITIVPTSALSINSIGRVFVSKGASIAISDNGQQTTLAKGSEVFLNDTIITAEDSFLVVKMNDDTKLTLRPNTEITLDNFSQERGNEKATIGLIKGGLRTITGSIGKKRPDQFLLQTRGTTIGIRGTNFITRLCEDDNTGNQCGNQCAIEEQQLSSYQRLATNTNISDITTEVECEPVEQISEGLYIGIFEGQINAATKKGNVDLPATGAARTQKDKTECLTEVPNFLTLDPYLSEDPENAVVEFNQTISPLNLFTRTDNLLKQGYSPNAIFNSEISKGNAIYSIVNAASASSPDRETEFRWLADLMLPGLPDSACDCVPFRKDRVWNEITYDSLESKTVEEVSRLFFEEGKHLARFNTDNTHGLFPVKELKKILTESSSWYEILPVRDHPIPAGVFVSLYKNGEEIIVDRNLGAIQDAVERGDQYIPVVFHYYWESTIPIGRFSEKMTKDDVAGVLGDVSTDVSPVPNWKVGDYHATMELVELKALVSIPEKDEIDQELWTRIEKDFEINGFIFPVILTPGDGFENYKLFNSVERVAVAESLGIMAIPVVLLEPPSRPLKISQCRALVRAPDPEQGQFKFLGGTGGPPAPDSSPPAPEPSSPAPEPSPPPLFTPPTVSP